jgi:hypothetical protein
VDVGCKGVTAAECDFEFDFHRTPCPRCRDGGCVHGPTCLSDRFP